MRTSDSYPVALAVAVTILVMAGSSAARETIPSKTPTAAKYVPLDLLARKDMYHKIEDERRDMIVPVLALIEELKDNPDEHQTETRLWYAVRALGAIRAEEAAVPLLGIVDVRFVRVLVRVEAPRDRDVIQALARIGKPASKAAVEYLAKDKSSKRALMYVRVIAIVEGVEVGKFMVERAAAAESDPEKKARLSKAIALFADADKVVP